MDKKICIAGKNEIAIKALDFCAKNYSIKNLFFISNKSDEGIDSWQKSFKKFALSKNCKEVNLEQIYELKDLIFISLEFSELINTDNFLSKELFNIHFSLLPKYKGMYTSAWPILNDEKFSGVTLHKIDNGIDTGDIIDQISFPLSSDETAKSLYSKYLRKSLDLFLKNINNIVNKNYIKKKQPSFASSYYSKSSINYKNLNINLYQTAYNIDCQIRAYNFREYQLPELFDWKIGKCLITKEQSKFKPGTIIDESKSGFLISTIDYNLFLKKDYSFYLFKYAKSDESLKIKNLLNYLDDLDVKNKIGETALIICAKNGCYSTFKLLVENGSNVFECDYRGYSVIYHSLKYYQETKDSKIFKYIFSCGVSSIISDNVKMDLVTHLERKNCLYLLE